MSAVQLDEYLLILAPFTLPTAIVERIKTTYPRITVTHHTYATGATVWDVVSEVPDEVFRPATILFTLSLLPPSRTAAPKLRLVHFFSAGVNHIQAHPIYADPSFTLTTSSGIHGPQIAEWVLMALLSHSHSLPGLLAWQKEHRWGRYDGLGAVRDLVGQRLGVLGYGSIGRQVANVGRAMGMDIVAFTASPRPTPESKADAGFIVPGTGDPRGEIPSRWFSGTSKSALHAFLSADIDVLLISVPLTAATTQLLDEAEFALLGRRQAYIVNISRGLILDQDALIAALKRSPEDGGLRGAALDVTNPEPLPADSELWDMPNVLVSPHLSGYGAAYIDRSLQVLEENLRRLEAGEGLLNVVDRERGY